MLSDACWPPEVSKLIGVSFPLIQAGMGGVATPSLAAAVSNAGCGGVLALYKQTPDEIQALVRMTRARTSLPFGVNLIPEVISESGLLAQIQAVLECSDRDVFFTTFGPAPEKASRHIRDDRRALLVQVGSAEQAKEAVRRGANGLILQGYGAGGHLLGVNRTDDLLNEVCQLNLGHPLIAAGGIGTGADFARSVSSGASGCLCGTLFLATFESGAHPAYKERVVQSRAGDTVVTDLFEIGWPGRVHRVLRNKVVEQGKTLRAALIAETTILGKTYWIPRFAAAVPTDACRGSIAEMAMYCGTSCQHVHAEKSVLDVILEFRNQAEESLRKGPFDDSWRSTIAV